MPTRSTRCTPAARRRAPRSAPSRRRRSACGRRPAATFPSSSRANSSRPSARVRGCPTTRPTRRRLVRGAGQRDVGEAEVLAALLDEVLAPVRRVVRSVEPDVDRARVAGVGSWNEIGWFVARDPARLPQERAVDDRELEALAAVDRQHLDRLGVGLEPAAALLVARVLAPPRRSAGAARRSAPSSPICSAVAAACSSCADVAQVGQPPLAVGRRRSTRSGRPSTSVIASVSDATPVARSTRAQWCRRRWTCLPRRPRRPPRPARRSSRGTGSARPRARAAGDVGRSSASSSAQPLARGAGGEHAARAVDHRGDARPPRARRGRRAALRLVRTSTATWPGRTGSCARRAVLAADLDLAPEESSSTRSRGEVARRCARARSCCGAIARARQLIARLVAAHDAQPQRRRDRRAGQPRPAFASAARTRAVDDALVAEPGAAEQRVVGVDQPLVAAPVHLQRGRACRRPRAASR